MTRKQTGDLRSGHMPNTAFGLTWEVIEDPRGELAYLSVGTFGHGGAFGTQAWIDPQSGVALILMVQRANFRNSDDSPVRLAFTEAALGGK